MQNRDGKASSSSSEAHIGHAQIRYVMVFGWKPLSGPRPFPTAGGARAHLQMVVRIVACVSEAALVLKVDLTLQLVDVFQRGNGTKLTS
jgi:hypothetical protein